MHFLQIKWRNSYERRKRYIDIYEREEYLEEVEKEAGEKEERKQKILNLFWTEITNLLDLRIYVTSWKWMKQIRRNS